MHLTCTIDGLAKQFIDTENAINNTILLLAKLIREKKPPFPTGINRVDLSIEILKFLYGLISKEPSFDIEDTSNVYISELGVLLSEIILLNDNYNQRVIDLKLSVIELLMHVKDTYTYFILANNVIQPILDLLKHQVSLIIIEKKTPSFYLVMPILSLCGMLSRSSKQAKKIIKDFIFPNDPVDPPVEKNLEPGDALEGTLRYMMIKLMTDFDSNVKRFANELLWELCSKDTDEFVKRTGLGNAIGFLQAQGHMAPVN